LVNTYTYTVDKRKKERTRRGNSENKRLSYFARKKNKFKSMKKDRKGVILILPLYIRSTKGSGG
jgi:hypothetical protein